MNEKEKRELIKNMVSAFRKKLEELKEKEKFRPDNTIMCEIHIGSCFVDAKLQDEWYEVERHLNEAKKHLDRLGIYVDYQHLHKNEEVKIDETKK